MSKALINVTNGHKSIFAARQQYWKGALTKRQFNDLVMLELARKSWAEVATLEVPWRWLALVGCYFDLKHLGIE